MRISASWEIEEELLFVFDGKPIQDLSDEELEKARQEVYDLWNWETGEKEDWELFEAIEREIKKRQTNDVEAELAEALAMNIADEIDQQILNSILDLAEEEEK